MEEGSPEMLKWHFLPANCCSKQLNLIYTKSCDISYPQSYGEMFTALSFPYFICKMVNIKLTLQSYFSIKLDDMYKVTVSRNVYSINYHQEIFICVHTVARIESGARFSKKHKT